LVRIAFAPAAASLRADPLQQVGLGIASLGNLTGADRQGLDRPLELIPARYSAVRAALQQLHHVPLGLSEKTLRNHKSNAKSALLWLANERGVPRYGIKPTPEWAHLLNGIKTNLVRWRIYAFARFCSANNISPEEVTEEIVDQFATYRETIGKPLDPASRRLLAKAWNSAAKTVPGWPQTQLGEPPRKSIITVPWEQFPPGLRADIDQYLESLTRVRRNPKGRRIRPLRPSTRRARFAELQAAARMAAENGVPIEKLTSLAALLKPDVARVILEAYWQSNGEYPKDFTINLGARFAAIAMETKCLNDDDCRALSDLRHTLEEYRRSGLTDKNVALIRKVLSPGVWAKVVNLPRAMMAEARRQKSRSPLRAAVTAQLATAIAILITAPIRLANLTSIRLDLNLVKPDGPESDYYELVAPTIADIVPISSRPSIKGSRFGREDSEAQCIGSNRPRSAGCLGPLWSAMLVIVMLKSSTARPLLFACLIERVNFIDVIATVGLYRPWPRFLCAGDGLGVTNFPRRSELSCGGQ
jgi:hypothetical protein